MSRTAEVVSLLQELIRNVRGVGYRLAPGE